METLSATIEYTGEGTTARICVWDSSGSLGSISLRLYHSPKLGWGVLGASLAAALQVASL